MSKKILLISQNFYPEIGSAGNRMKNIYKLLKESGYDVTVLTTEPAYPNKHIYEDEGFWDDSFINENKKDIKRVKITNRKYSRSILNRLFYYLEFAIKMVLFILFKRNKFDVVFATSPAIFIGMVGVLAKYHYKSKFILEIRDLWPESLKGVGVFNYPIILMVFGKVEKFLYKKADKIVVNSEGFIEHISTKAKLPLSKISYIPNGARKHELRLSKENKNEFSVIYAGNMGLAQDINLIKELAFELEKLNIKFTIIGYGLRKDDFTGFVKSEKLSNVHFVKPRTRQACLNIIAQHQVGIVTLTGKEVFETVLPGKVIDYMTCQIPIVAAVSGTSKGIIQREEIGFVSETRNVNEMVEFILQLQNNPDQQVRLAENGLSYVETHSLWEKNINRLIEIIEA